MVRKARLYCDGASRGNPGDAGIGGVLIVEDRKITYSEHIGATTNNIAEYRALLKGLEIALAESVTSIEVFSDSELMVRQVRGIYKVKSDHLKPLHDQALTLLRRFMDCSVTHVGRGHNTEADDLAKSATRRTS